MSVGGMTRWQICKTCGRKFLTVDRKDSEADWSVHCPECRAGMMRQVIKDMTDKWLRSK
ncbi:MAG: hypothetical protein PHQ46_00830 [Negativicutes bacterium]|nr:hypothetical protein [Negativicutes bacterium]